jgi:hypothetical protein
VAGWRRERMPEMPDDEPIRVVPDWVCEILSKTTRQPQHPLEHVRGLGAALRHPCRDRCQ